MRTLSRTLLAGTAAAALSLTLANADPLPDTTGFGPHPAMPKAHEALLPTLNIAPAVHWSRDGQPVAAHEFKVNAFARGLNHPRFLYTLPNGDVLAVETASPGSEPVTGIRGWVQKQVMTRAGSVVPSANRITLLRDANGDGVAEIKSVFVENLHSPFGVVLVGNDLYVANCDSLVRFKYQTGQTSITERPTKIIDLPSSINHHWTKTVVASRDGKFLYVSIGSNSNIGDNGMQAEIGRASVWVIDRASGQSRTYATGLRNAAGLAINPETGRLWAAVNERDEIGDNVPPDYMTQVRQGGFYGWPYSYWGHNVDDRVKPQRPDLVAKAIEPDYGLGPHTASLGLAFYTGAALPEHYRNGAFVGQHGSWNRGKLNGYQVIFVPFHNGKPSGMPELVLSGFVNADGDAQGRPVGIAIDKRGAVLVADDVGNAVWRVTSATSTAMNR